VRGGYTHSWFTPLSPRDVFGVSFRTGVIVPVGDSDAIPLQERYFNGGENTVRSFKEDQLGPQDADGDPIGGEAYTVISAELRHTLGGRLGAAFFFDLGNVQEDASDYFHFDNGGAAVGAGLRYLLPVGPVRLDVGVNPDPGDDDDTWVAHLSVGVPF
jgi:outer membrane protein assembly factor BamA